MLCMAAHDTSEWQHRKPSEVDEEASVELKIYNLFPGEVDEFSRKALKAARHEIALEVLDEVSHELDGHDIYEFDPRTVLPSPADIGAAVLAEHPDKSRLERKNIAMEEYRLADSYEGKTEEQAIRDALDSWFYRNE